jgi:hypothetical protein
MPQTVEGQIPARGDDDLVTILGPKRYEHWLASRRFLAQVDLLDKQIVEAKSDKPRHRRLLQARSRLCQEFARHLDAGKTLDPPMKDPTFEEGLRRVWIALKIVGVPSKHARQQASEWMMARGIAWDGDVPALRREVRKALGQGEAIPDGNFGLRAERTAEIGFWDTPRYSAGYYGGNKAAPSGPEKNANWGWADLIF